MDIHLFSAMFEFSGSHRSFVNAKILTCTRIPPFKHFYPIYVVPQSDLCRHRITATVSHPAESNYRESPFHKFANLTNESAIRIAQYCFMYSTTIKPKALPRARYLRLYANKERSPLTLRLEGVLIQIRPKKIYAKTLALNAML